MIANNRKLKKFAFYMSICLILIWAILGAGTSLAWFSHSSAPVKNIFHFADFDLDVLYLSEGVFKPIDENTNVFDEADLFEPGYIQIVYLKVQNKGTVPFNFKTSVVVNDYNVVSNANGGTFALRDYLRFGMVSGNTLADVEAKVATRDLATEISSNFLDSYETDPALLAAGGESYMALVVRMPKEVGNDANYRGDVVPQVTLGLAVDAVQVMN